MERGNSDSQSVGFVVFGLVRFVNGPAEYLDNRHCMCNEDAPGGSRDDTPVAALEEARLDSTLNLCKLLAEGRLGDAKAFGRRWRSR